MDQGERTLPRRSRLSAWWKGVEDSPAPMPAPPSASPPADPPETGLAAMRRAADQDVIARIAAFLTTHDLSPTTDHLLIARRHALGEDPLLAEAIEAQVQAGLRVSPAFLDRFAASRTNDRLTAAALADLADTLGAALSESHASIDRSCESARDYQAALGGALQGVATDPAGTIERLVALTAAAVERTQDLAERLDATRRETHRLRGRLQAARRAAEQDHLTRLPNRRGFDAQIARTADASQRAVALCDIDNFKRINDQHGHDTGDRVLKVVARHLKTALGGKVMVARHGGEEFACLFEGVDLHGARQALDRAREQLGERSFLNQDDGVPIGRITFSAGLAPLDTCPRRAMRAADAALYAAKRAGKDRIVVAQPGGEE